MNSIFNPQIANENFVKTLTAQFQQAQPYKHVVIENFLDEKVANRLYENFPSFDKLSRHYKGLNESKSEGADFENFDESFRQLRAALKEKDFMETVEKITGIKNIYTTDDNLGTGVHQGKNGSYLDVHIDFNIHHVRNIHRRLNLLIYLNKDWKESYGGKIEMWNTDVSKCIQSYLPSFNRCVIFETSEISYHGYSKISVPENITRKSVYSYYYTDVNDYKGKYHDTIFKARPEEGFAKRVKTDVKETLKNNIKYVLKKLGVKF